VIRSQKLRLGVQCHTRCFFYCYCYIFMCYGLPDSLYILTSAGGGVRSAPSRRRRSCRTLTLCGPLHVSVPLGVRVICTCELVTIKRSHRRIARIAAVCIVRTKFVERGVRAVAACVGRPVGTIKRTHRRMAQLVVIHMMIIASFERDNLAGGLSPQQGYQPPRRKSDRV
jgi:hypothetical protein